MRKLLFRGKKEENAPYVYFDFNQYLDSYNDPIPYVLDSLILPETREQYTGIKDWYEGDIIGKNLPEFIIQYDERNAMYNGLYIGSDDYYEGNLGMLAKEECKKFGTTYENPELLIGDE